MNIKTFGKTGLRVSEVALGAMTFGDELGWGATKDTAQQLFDTYANAGGNFIDTANIYTNGTSERFTGEFINADRDYFVLATKYAFNANPNNPNAGGAARKNLVQSVNASLKRLGTDYIDLLWVHVYDPLTPIDEMLRGLDDLVRQGKVLYIGISDAPAWVVSYSQAVAELRGWSAFAGIQVEYSLVQRGIERDLLPMARHFGLAVAAWSPLASGLLTGKYSSSKKPEGGRLEVAPFVPLSERNLRIADAVIAVANEAGTSPAQVALNWVLRQDNAIIPIIGATKLPQLEDNLKALDVTLSDEQLKRLNETSQIELGFPHDFLTWSRPQLIGERPVTTMY